MGYIDHRRLIHSEAKKIGENHFALCSGHHVLIAPLSHANLSRLEHENLESDCPKRTWITRISMFCSSRCGKPRQRLRDINRRLGETAR